MARHSAVFVFYNRVNIDLLKLNLLPNRVLENFLDALRLGIRPFLCFKIRLNRFPKIEFATENSDRELLGRFVARHSAGFVFHARGNKVKIDFLKLNLLPETPIESFWDALWLGIRPFLCIILVEIK